MRKPCLRRCRGWSRRCEFESVAPVDVESSWGLEASKGTHGGTLPASIGTLGPCLMPYAGAAVVRFTEDVCTVHSIPSSRCWAQGWGCRPETAPRLVSVRGLAAAGARNTATTERESWTVTFLETVRSGRVRQIPPIDRQPFACVRRLEHLSGQLIRCHCTCQAFPAQGSSSSSTFKLKLSQSPQQGQGPGP